MVIQKQVEKYSKRKWKLIRKVKLQLKWARMSWEQCVTMKDIRKRREKGRWGGGESRQRGSKEKEREREREREEKNVKRNETQSKFRLKRNLSSHWRKKRQTESVNLKKKKKKKKNDCCSILTPSATLHNRHM